MSSDGRLFVDIQEINLNAPPPSENVQYRSRCSSSSSTLGDV